MKKLFLVRHAKSSRDNAQLADFDRPLNDRGLRDAPFMGKLFAERKIRVDGIVSSPALRAKTTAEFFAVELKVGKMVFNGDIYDADTRTLLGIILQLDPTWNSVMMFGHNPGFSQIATIPGSIVPEYLFVQSEVVA